SRQDPVELLDATVAGEPGSDRLCCDQRERASAQERPPAGRGSRQVRGVDSSIWYRHRQGRVCAHCRGARNLCPKQSDLGPEVEIVIGGYYSWAYLPGDQWGITGLPSTPRLFQRCRRVGRDGRGVLSWIDRPVSGTESDP